MRFTALLAAAAANAVSGVASTPAFPSIPNFDPNSMSASNHFGSPLAFGQEGAQPGWYFGSNPKAVPNIPYLDEILCRILEYIPHVLHCPKKMPPPPPNDGYFQTFKNLSCATQTADFQTFGLVDTETQCKAMCNSVSGCNFVNVFLDANRNTQLTCSLFTECHDASTADNCGGQTQEPSGLLDFIVGSDGFCKDGQKIADPK